MKRHKWFKGIHLPTGISEYREPDEGTWIYNSYGYNARQMCGIAVNDSIAALFGLKEAYNQTNCRPNTLIDCDFHWEDKLTKLMVNTMIDKRHLAFPPYEYIESCLSPKRRKHIIKEVGGELATSVAR